MALARAKIKTTKISSEGLTGNSTKVCTSENFPLYGIVKDRDPQKYNPESVNCNPPLYMVYHNPLKPPGNAFAT